jgi:deazaflavin-dependent oxidoreductase (nitroreductase family)
MTSIDEEHTGTTEMTDSNSPSAAKPGVRAKTLPIQGPVNSMIRGLLHTPLLARIVGRRLVTLYVVGRRTGRHYAVPVAYTRHEDNLLVGSQFAWIRNLSNIEPVHIRLSGKRRQADVQVLTEEAAVVDHLALMAKDNHQFAKFNRIGLDRDGNPSSDDLRLAWAAGARVAILTPR